MENHMLPQRVPIVKIYYEIAVTVNNENIGKNSSNWLWSAMSSVKNIPRIVFDRQERWKTAFAMLAVDNVFTVTVFFSCIVVSKRRTSSQQWWQH